MKVSETMLPLRDHKEDLINLELVDSMDDEAPDDDDADDDEEESEDEE